jgi:hypothetical protein
MALVKEIEDDALHRNFDAGVVDVRAVLLSRSFSER